MNNKILVGNKIWVIVCALLPFAGVFGLCPSAKMDSERYILSPFQIVSEGKIDAGAAEISFSGFISISIIAMSALFILGALIQVFFRAPYINAACFFLGAVFSIPLIYAFSQIGGQLDAVFGAYYCTVDYGIGLAFPLVFGIIGAVMCLLQSEKISMLVLKHRIFDRTMHVLVIFSAALSVLALIGILAYVLINGIGGVFEPGFLTRTYEASADSPNKGILPMIINTLYIVVLSLVFAIPIGICTAVYLTQYAKQGRLVKAIRFTTDTLAGIPSIIYGLFGFTFFVTLCKLSYSIMAGALTLAIMILPTIIRTTEESLRSVPSGYKEGGLALGAGKLKVLYSLVIPCAAPGILTSVILATGRIVGETAVLMFTAGIVVRMPVFNSLADVFSYTGSSGRSLALHLYQVAMLGGEGALDHAFATASVLLVIVFVLNMCARLVSRLAKNKKGEC